MPATIPFSDLPVKVSVIIPTYNRALLIPEAIQSVLAQTFSGWELIIVDDGSTDHTLDFIASINDPRIHVLALPHCGNIASLRNAGVNNSSGDLIAFLDSDDVWIPEKLAIQMEAMKKQAARWCYGGFEMTDETGKQVPDKHGLYHPYSGWIVNKLLTYEATANISSIVLQRSLFDEVGGFNTNEELFCREDYEFVLRLALQEKACSIGLPLVRIKDHPGRTTNSITNGPERTANVYKYFYTLCSNKALKILTKKQYARHLAEAAEKNLYFKKYSRAIKYFTKAIIKGDSPAHLFHSFKRGFGRHQQKI